MFYNYKIYGNSILQVSLFVILIFFSFLTGKILKYLIHKKINKKGIDNNKIIIFLLNVIEKSIQFILFSIFFYLTIKFIELPSNVKKVITTVSELLYTMAFGIFFYRLVGLPDLWLKRISGLTENKLGDMLVPVVRKSLKLVVIIFVVIEITDIFSDEPITSVLAGLGIGGLAVALGAQDTIKNFFASIFLFVDKPFDLGDRIVIDKFDGPVEDVGLRSTKIRTLEGHLVTIPNSELSNRAVQNIGQRPFIRRIANIGITYDTSPEKLDRAVEILKDILDNHEGMNPEFPPKVYFSEFASYFLNIMVIYWYHPPEYWKYMEFSERFNKEVFKRFYEEGINFAFPTQTLHIAQPSDLLPTETKN